MKVKFNVGVPLTNVNMADQDRVLKYAGDVTLRLQTPTYLPRVPRELPHTTSMPVKPPTAAGVQHTTGSSPDASASNASETDVTRDPSIKSKNNLTAIFAHVFDLCWEQAWEYKSAIFTSLWRDPKTTIIITQGAVLGFFALPSLFSLIGFRFSIPSLITHAVFMGLTALVTYRLSIPRNTSPTSFMVPLDDVNQLHKDRVRVMVRVMNAELSKLLDVFSGQECRDMKMETARLMGLLGTTPVEASDLPVADRVRSVEGGGGFITTGSLAPAPFHPSEGRFKSVPFQPGAGGKWY
ncbi:hypothetical protein P153DRAFT_361831 [Dothidotthia symphoricarpi CBS 119687]|uniref:Uncharacterized protein n=1 Tax=Dothidotthia symphoricarpi CBS 119687 TaxID=1392245 RepID=A0A6A5ZWN3_9PLEO|nr:uncharacterized protein P153DRAFT_361831 [Dothidotthia symphoricarpi CBS 119687]KAF2123706.1 hypothetical protein P153DRAFT_361831 [Dothidotthia symphoricarpi CBS 119687]